MEPELALDLMDKIAGNPCTWCEAGDAMEIISMGGVVVAPSGETPQVFHRECWVESLAEPKDDSILDPPHHRDENEPCYSCGAKWVRDDHGLTMEHKQPCEFLESIQYGGTKEVR